MEKSISSKLNLGCGNRFHSDWVNVNFTSTGPGVIAANLNKGIPFPDSSFDVVYHSHLLEHFTRSAAIDFLKECFRVLKPDGIIRLAVPDLEAIAVNYLRALERARAGTKGWEHNYDWIMLELYDQVARNKSGGDMALFLADPHLNNEEFVISRCGAEAKNIISAARKNRSSSPAAIKPKSKKNVKNLELTTIPSIVRFAYWILFKPSGWKEQVLQKLLGNEYELLNTGRFRFGGEIHQWMYDSYSLDRLLRICGFRSVKVRNATESYIPDWLSYNLDTEPDGTVYKPDSIFIEALK